MSYDTNKRRLSRIEAQTGVNTFPADQRDPRLVELLQQWGGEKFRLDDVPYGISSFEFVNRLMDGMKGKFGTLEPVKRPPSGWPAG